MIEKIKNNIKYIMFLAAFVSIGLVIPSIFGLFSSEITDTSIISLLYYAGIILTNIFILIMANKKIEEINITIPLLLICIAKIISYVNGIMNNQYINLVYIGLYLSILILQFIKCNKKALFALYILLALAISFTILNVFTGSQLGLASLICLSMIFLIIYLQKGKGEE